MFIDIQTVAMTKNHNYDNTVLSLRLESAEAVRFWNVMDAVKKRNPYISKSDVIRELFGINDAVALTLEEIEYFRKGKTKTETRQDRNDIERDYGFNVSELKNVDAVELDKIEPRKKRKTG